MEANKEETLKAKEMAEKRFCERDFTGAKTYALKAKSLYPGLEGISQMVSTFEVHAASEAKCNGETDYYLILGLKPTIGREAVKKQYRKLAVLLHPDKNKCVGAAGAFKLVSEAWTFLSDRIKRSSHEIKRNKQMPSGVVQTSTYAAGVTCVNATSQRRLDTFWTVCTSCKIQYEYIRKYVNKRLSCKNCRGTFIAVETGSAPVNGSFPYCPWSYMPSNGYESHGNGVMSQKMLLFSLEMGSQVIILGIALSMFLTCLFIGARSLEILPQLCLIMEYQLFPPMPFIRAMEMLE